MEIAIDAKHPIDNDPKFGLDWEREHIMETIGCDDAAGLVRLDVMAGEKNWHATYRGSPDDRLAREQALILLFASADRATYVPVRDWMRNPWVEVKPSPAV
jgi:hypothetical protein